MPRRLIRRVGRIRQGRRNRRYRESRLFDIDSNVLEEKMEKEVTITQSVLYRTSENFGVSFTVKNKTGAPLSDVTVHARLLNKKDEPIDTFETALSEAESIVDLDSNEKWNGEIVFEDTDPNVVLKDVKAYEIWATAQAEQTVTDDGSGGNASSGNATNGDNSTSGTTPRRKALDGQENGIFSGLHSK